jgi:hypothetical protein
MINESRKGILTYLIPALIIILVCPYGSVIFFLLQGASFCAMVIMLPTWALFMDWIMLPFTLVCSTIELIFINRYLHYRNENLRLGIAMRDFFIAGGLLAVFLAFLWPGLTYLSYPEAERWRNIMHTLIAALITGSLFGLLFSLSVYLGQRKK